MLIKYPKIDCLFERNSDFKLTNTFRDPAFEYLKDLKWEGFEKLDRTNVRIYWDGYRVSTHGRTDNAVFEKSFEEYLEKFKSKEFAEVVNYVNNLDKNTATKIQENNFKIIELFDYRKIAEDFLKLAEGKPCGYYNKLEIGGKDNDFDEW